tara:strand:- start:7341 stop:8576 length:1236 start_codon:yes stop_codon:yes gene_type:complete
MFEKTLGSKINVLSGFAFPSSGFTTEEGMPLIRIRDIANRETEINYMGPYPKEYEVENGDLLIGMDGDFNVIRWEGSKALLNQRVCKIKSSSIELNQKFLFWYLIPHISNIHRTTPQTTVKHLSTKNIYKIASPAFTYEEQKTIAHILDTLDTQIRQTEAIIAKLQQVKQGLLHDLLTRGIDENGQLRPPYEQAPELYKESPLGWIPKEWEIYFLDEVAKRGSGHTPDKNVSSYWNGGIKWVSLADSNKLDDHYINLTAKEISDAGIANSSAKIHKKGTVILSRDAGIGKSSILGNDMAVSQHFIAWLCSQKISGDYLYFWLQKMKPKFESIAIGSTIKTIGLPFFKTLKITVPPRPEQEIITSRLVAARKKQHMNEVELVKLKKQKAGLMDDLLTGRVRVTELIDQPQAS